MKNILVAVMAVLLLAACQKDWVSDAPKPITNRLKVHVHGFYLDTQGDAVSFTGVGYSFQDSNLHVSFDGDFYTIRGTVEGRTVVKLQWEMQQWTSGYYLVGDTSYSPPDSSTDQPWVKGSLALLDTGRNFIYKLSPYPIQLRLSPANDPSGLVLINFNATIDGSSPVAPNMGIEGDVVLPLDKVQ